MGNIKLIQTHILRECAGEGCVSWERLLPILGNPNGSADILYYHLPKGSLLSGTFKGKTLMDQPWQSKGKYFSERQKSGLRVFLTRDIGLSLRSTEILINRPRIQFLRIEEFISGLVDSLWLAEEKVFLVGSQESLLIRNLVRKIFKTGTYNLYDLVAQWKEWGNFLFHTAAKTDTIGPLKVPEKKNIFRILNKIPYISRMYQSEVGMLELQHISHLISSRQMPYMGSETEKRAKEGFKKVLQDSYRPDRETLTLLALSARRIGGICKRIRPNPIPEGSAHFSVTSSGEMNWSVRNGAQAKAVQEALVRILSRVPEEDEEENTPFGPVKHRKGIPIWKTLFRTEEETMELFPYEFLQPVEFGFPKEQEGRFHGLDRVTGKQTMYVAWKEISPTPVCRAEVVPEMGNKARFVTVSEYWLNVLQAPLSHVLIEAMKYHPSVFSSFHRQDQAWEAVKGLCHLDFDRIKMEQMWCLSSDLKDATNAQQFDLTKVMIKSFIQGYGLELTPEYVDLVIGTIGPRLVLFRDGTSILSSTGIMMGEAIAKPSLTLLNLSIEECAYAHYISKPEYVINNLVSTEPSFNTPWRYIHIGGDDHLAYGPRRYLELITQFHQRAGSHIDPGKHGYSKVAVRYTERVINLTNLKYKKPFHEDYALSTIVDSVKVRLLERGQSTMIKKDNKNVAIGKSSQIGGCLEWLPNDDRFWTIDKKVSIRNLFIERMGPLLPRKAKNPKCYAHIHLPVELGGFGLGLKSETLHFAKQAPSPTRWVLNKIYQGDNVRADLKIFRQLNHNISTRGVEKILSFQQKIIDQLMEYPSMVNAIDWRELQKRFPPINDNPRSTIDQADRAGFLSFEEFAKRATRGNLFQSLLMGEGPLKEYNTNPFVSTYKRVWRQCEEANLDIYPDELLETDNEKLYRAIKSVGHMWYFDINQITAMDIGYWNPDDPDSETWDFRDDTYINKYRGGFPDLTVGFKLLGLKH